MSEKGKRKTRIDLLISLPVVILSFGTIIADEIFHFTERIEIVWIVCILLMILCPLTLFLRHFVRYSIPDKDPDIQLSDASLRWAEANSRIKGSSMYDIVSGYCRRGILRSIGLVLVLVVLSIMLIFAGTARYELMDDVPARFKLLTALVIVLISIIIGGRADLGQCMTSDFKEAVRAAGIDEAAMNRDFMYGTIFPVFQGFLNIGTLYCSSYSKQKCTVLKLEDISKVRGYFEDRTANGQVSRFYWLECTVNNKKVFFRMKDETTMKLIIQALVIHGIDAAQLK